MAAPWWLVGRGSEALYGREELWGTGAAKLELISFRLTFGCSAWNGLAAEEAPRSVRNGFVVFAGGFVGIRASKSTKDAAVGPRKDSGVAHVRDLVLARLSLRPDMLKRSELSSSRPLTLAWPPSITSSNRSPSDGLPLRAEGSLNNPLDAVLLDEAKNGSAPEGAEVQSWVFRLEVLSSQGYAGGSHGGGGLWEGGTIQGESALGLWSSRESQGSVALAPAAAWSEVLFQ